MRVRVVLAATAAAAVLAGTAEAAPRYTALGDSFAAGPLIPTPLAPLGCLKSSNNYGHTSPSPRRPAAARGPTTCSRRRTCAAPLHPNLRGLQAMAAMVVSFR